MQRSSNLVDYPGDPAGVVGFVEMAEDISNLLIPEGGADLAVNSFIAKDRNLPVLQGDIDEHAVAASRLLHIQAGENLRSPVDGVDITAAALDIHPNLAAGTMFGSLDSRYDLLLLGIVKQRLFRKEWPSRDLFSIELNFGGVSAPDPTLKTFFCFEPE